MPAKILMNFFEVEGNLHKLHFLDYVPEDCKTTWTAENLSFVTTTPLEFYICCAYESRLLFDGHRFADTTVSDASSQFIHPCTIALHTRSAETLLLLLQYGAFLDETHGQVSSMKMKSRQTNKNFVHKSEMFENSSCITSHQEILVSAVKSDKSNVTISEDSSTCSNQFLIGSTVPLISTTVKTPRFLASMDAMMYTILQDSIAIFHALSNPNALKLNSFQLKIVLDTIHCAKLLLRAYPSSIPLTALLHSSKTMLNIYKANIIATELGKYGLSTLAKRSFSPPELLHLCRCSIRKILHKNWQLPAGIKQLGLSTKLAKYLNLEMD